MIRKRCDCGDATARGTSVCVRCAELDGDGLAPSASAVIAALRLVTRATWADLECEIRVFTGRTLRRAIGVLLAAGRVRRIDVEVDGSIAAAFELISGSTSSVAPRLRRRREAKADRRRSQRRRLRDQSRHKAGLCHRCPSPTNRWLCRRCSKANTASSTERERQRFRDGFCRCGAAPRPGFALCEDCAAMRRRQKAEDRARRIAAGLCMICKRKRAGRTYCAEHEEVHRTNAARWWRRKQALKRAGIARVA